MPPTLGRFLGGLQRPLQGRLGSPTVQCAAEAGARFRSAVPRCGSVSNLRLVEVVAARLCMADTGTDTCADETASYHEMLSKAAPKQITNDSFSCGKHCVLPLTSYLQQYFVSIRCPYLDARDGTILSHLLALGSPI